MAKAVFSIASTDFQAESLVNELKVAGFSEDDISVLLPDKTGTFGHERHTKAPEGAAAGAGTVGIIGGALGWLAGVGALAIPGAGPFIAAGPIMAALSGAAVGAAVGGIAGALIGMGIPEFEAKRYEQKIKSGNILISVHCKDAEDTKKAKDIFSQGGAQDISTSTEAEVRIQPPEVRAEKWEQW